jgi:beta-lactamase class A
MKRNSIIVILVCLVFISGYLMSYFINSNKQDKINTQYSLLAKRLFVDNPNDIQFDFRELKQSLEFELENGLSENEKKASVYFEYLPSNVSFSINAELKAVAASLMKTAVAMEVFKNIENGIISKTDTIILEESMLDNSYGNLYKVGPGSQYTVEELIDIMLIKSDNTASNALISTLNNPFNTLNILKILDINTTADENQRLTIGSEDYSQIFKCLYFACYNSMQHSQEILSILVNSEYKERIPKLLPSDSLVAHKIGTFNNEFQSDCGIIYANGGTSNYLLCVMVNADDPEASEEIARISYKVYSYVNSLNDN